VGYHERAALQQETDVGRGHDRVLLRDPPAFYLLKRQRITIFSKISPGLESGLDCLMCAISMAMLSLTVETARWLSTPRPTRSWSVPHHQASERVQIVVLNCMDLYHKSPGSGDPQREL